MDQINNETETDKTLIATHKPMIVVMSPNGATQEETVRLNEAIEAAQNAYEVAQAEHKATGCPYGLELREDQEPCAPTEVNIADSQSLAFSKDDEAFIVPTNPLPTSTPPNEVEQSNHLIRRPSIVNLVEGIMSNTKEALSVYNNEIIVAGAGLNITVSDQPSE